MTSVLACHGQPRILDAVLLLLLSEQSSTGEGGRWVWRRLSFKEKREGRAERGGAQQNLDHRVLKDRTALTIQCVIRRKKIQICPPLKIFIYLFIYCVCFDYFACTYVHA